MTIAMSRSGNRLPGPSDQDQAILRGLAGLHFNYGQYRVAESLLDLALWLDPGDKSSHAMMARVLVRQRRGQEARTHIDKARKVKVRT